MSITKTSNDQYFSIDQFNWTLPCTLEIKFSTCGTGGGISGDIRLFLEMNIMGIGLETGGYRQPADIFTFGLEMMISRIQANW